MRDVVFQGLAAPLRLHEAEAILPILRDIVPGWGFVDVPADPSATPFYSISAKPGEPLLWCDCHIDDRPKRWYDPVNAICDAISALALALPAERPDLICLHAAAVALAGRLVVFPNIRRAGKSTLTAALAQAGFGVFSDDVLPVFYANAGRAHGAALGIAPRLRLPLPQTAGPEFEHWVATVSGPSNRQYRYLAIADQPRHGETLPIGAFVILDRQEEPVAATLSKVSPDVAMDALLHQNFTRDRHSADILRHIAATLAECPAFQLTYFDLDGAVACLKEAFAAWPDPAPATHPGPGQPFRMADLAYALQGAPDTRPHLRQRPGSLALTIGDKRYLADPDGRAIHRMDALAAAIWAIIEDPTPSETIVDILAEVFPEAERDRITSDVARLLDGLLGSGLVDTHPR